MSQSGMGLDMRQAQAVAVDERLDFCLQLPKGDLQGCGSVRWLHRDTTRAGQGTAVQAKLGIELEMTPALLRRLQHEVAQRQKRILTELKIVGVPDSLS